MKIVDAYWEKRNLGVTTAEVTVENGDRTADLAALERVCNAYEYVVVRVPSAMPACAFEVQRMGFMFMEGIMHVTNDLNDLSLSPALAPINESIRHRLVTQNSISEVVQHITPAMFDRDRISLDPFFPKEASALRYRNWLQDLSNQNSMIYEVLYANEPFGFFAIKQTGGASYHIPLLGLYEGYKDAGLGFVMYRRPHELARANKARRITGAVSSNNLPAVRMHIAFGDKISKIHHVFIKHRMS